MTKVDHERNCQGVTQCRRLIMRRNGKVLPSASHVLMFHGPKLPQKVPAGTHSLDMRAFILQLMQRFKCQCFGYTAVKCERQEI